MDTRDDHTAYELTGSGVRLLVHHIDLRDDMAHIETQADSLLTRVLPDQAAMATP